MCVEVQSSPSYGILGNILLANVMLVAKYFAIFAMQICTIATHANL